LRSCAHALVALMRSCARGARALMRSWRHLPYARALVRSCLSARGTRPLVALVALVRSWRQLPYAIVLVLQRSCARERTCARTSCERALKRS
jgi:hypothetical protein